MIITTINFILDAYSFLLLVRILFSFVNQGNQGRRPHQIIVFVYRITDVILKPVQKVIKPVLVGNMYLDFAPLIVLFLINMLQRYLIRLV